MRVSRLLLVAVVLVSGCSWSKIRDLDPAPPPPPSHALILGRVNLPPERFRAPWKATWSHHERAFEKGLREWLARNRSDWAFATLDELQFPTSLPPDRVILTGTITNITYGVAALRFLPGFGAGQEKVSGDFELRAADGRLLSRYHAREAYLGGFAIGGPDLINMDRLVRRLAERLAKKTVDTVTPGERSAAR